MDKLKEKVYCSKCNQETNHGIIITHKTKSDYFDIFQWFENYHIVQCLGCDKIAFVNEYDDETMHYRGKNEYDDWVDINEGPVYNVYPEKRVLPSKLNVDYKPKSYNKVPNNLNKLYKDVVLCYNNDAYLLAGTGLRMIVEGICLHLQIESGPVKNNDTGDVKIKKDLVGKINGIAEKGFIHSGALPILHEIRQLGNEIAHELKEPNLRTIGKAIEIIELMFTNIFELPEMKLKK